MVIASAYVHIADLDECIDTFANKFPAKQERVNSVGCPYR